MVASELKGKIGFEGHSIYCVIGDRPNEREIEQEIVVDLLVEADFAAVSSSDNLSDTIDYVMLANLCAETAQKGRYRMVETYAAEITKLILELPHIQSVWIKVRKPGALKNAFCAMVELKRKKTE